MLQNHTTLGILILKRKIHNAQSTYIYYTHATLHQFLKTKEFESLLDIIKYVRYHILIMIKEEITDIT